MGTRADFYVGRGEGAEWLGSIAWDGYPTAVLGREHRTLLMDASSEEAFREAVKVQLGPREDFTRPEDGWPWPWETSNTTDYAYAFDEGQLWVHGQDWRTAAQTLLDAESEEEREPGPRGVFPNMKHRQNVTLGKRSGVLVFALPGED